MSRSIRSYPENMRASVIARRMRQYDPKGANGIGVLAAHDYHVRHLGLSGKPKKQSPSDVRRAERRKKK